MVKPQWKNPRIMSKMGKPQSFKCPQLPTMIYPNNSRIVDSNWPWPLRLITSSGRCKKIYKWSEFWSKNWASLHQSNFKFKPHQLHISALDFPVLKPLQIGLSISKTLRNMQENVEIGNCGEKSPQTFKYQIFSVSPQLMCEAQFTSNVMTIDLFFFSMTLEIWNNEREKAKTQRWSQIRRPISNKILKYHFSRWYLIPIEIMFSNTLVALFVSFSLSLFSSASSLPPSVVSVSIIIRRYPMLKINYHHGACTWRLTPIKSAAVCALQRKLD